MHTQLTSSLTAPHRKWNQQAAEYVRDTERWQRTNDKQRTKKPYPTSRVIRKRRQTNFTQHQKIISTSCSHICAMLHFTRCASLAGRQMQIALHIRRVNIWRQNGALRLNTTCTRTTPDYFDANESQNGNRATVRWDLKSPVLNVKTRCLAMKS